MCSVKFFVLLLALVLSGNAATIKEEDAPAQANLGDLMGLFGGFMTAMAPKEEAEEIQKQMGQMSELLGGIGLIPTGAESLSAADSEAPIVEQQQADDNSEYYLKVSSTGQASFNQSNTMGIYVLQETRVNNFPVWKRQGDGEDQYLFVSTDGYWGIGPDLNTTEAGLYLPQNDPTPKSPINAQGWLYVVNVDQDWDIDDTINVEVFTGGYEINSFGGAAEQYPNLMGRYRLTSTIINDFPVYEIEKNGNYGYIFVDSDGFWTAGEDFDSDFEEMYCNDDTDYSPGNPPSEGWLFWNDDVDEWQSDPTFTFQYVRDL